MLRDTFSTCANEWQTIFGPCSYVVTGLGSKCFGCQMVATIMGIHLLESLGFGCSTPLASIEHYLPVNQ